MFMRFVVPQPTPENLRFLTLSSTRFSAVNGVIALRVAILTDQRPDLAVVDRGYRGYGAD